MLMFMGCTTSKEVSINDTEGVPVESGYPSSVSVNNDAEGYPYPGYEPSIATGLTPIPSLGIVHGRILYRDEPVVGYSVYLADLLADQDGIERIASLKRSSSPQAVLDKNGVFVFNEVPPDRYALMFSDGLNSYLLLYPDVEIDEAILVEVEADGISDLGVLNYLEFPID